MPLVGEQAWSGWAYSVNGPFTLSWDLDFPPSAAFIKVFLAGAKGGSAEVGLINIRRRLPNNADQTINFPAVGEPNTVYVQFNQTMTHVTFGMRVRDGTGRLVWTLGFWN